MRSLISNIKQSKKCKNTVRPEKLVVNSCVQQAG